MIGGNRLVETDGCLHPEINYHVIPRLFGGKGGKETAGFNYVELANFSRSCHSEHIFYDSSFNQLYVNLT